MRRPTTLPEPVIVTVSDPVVPIRDRLVELVQTVPGIGTDSVVTFYGQNELLSSAKALQLPAIGVVYVGMVGKRDSSNTGSATEVSFDVYLLGGDKCHAVINGAPADALAVLGCIRAHIIRECSRTPHAHRKFRLQYETPRPAGQHLAYVQRWTTTAIITPDRRQPARG